MHGCEFLTHPQDSRNGSDIIKAMAEASPIPVQHTQRYEGGRDWLMLWGLGRREHAEAVAWHVAPGRHAILWDLGYWGREKRGGYLRLSLDSWHPPQWLDRTEPDPVRWDAMGIELQDLHDPNGHIVLVGMGPKSHSFLGSHGWELRKFEELRRRFPGRRIVFRPKPNRPAAQVPCEIHQGALGDVLRGASLVVCRHSNVGIDAVVRGIPVECEDGAATWLHGKTYDHATRLDFLRRLAWWQWKTTDAPEAWQFILKVAA